MTVKEFRKRFNRAVGRMGLSLGMFCVRVFPRFLFWGIMRFFTFFWFHGAKRLRKVTRESLTIAFGDSKTPEDINKIVRQCFENVSRSMMDLTYFSMHPVHVKDRFVIEGKPYLDESLQKGKGVILVTAHFGNFPLMMLELAQLGYKPSVIIRKMRDTAIANTIYKIMTGVGVGTIYSLPARESVKQSLQVLRDKNILCVLLDQNFGSGAGVFVEFFGRMAATATGPVVMAERTGAQILPCFTIREGNNYRVIFEPPFHLDNYPDYDEMLRINVTKITKIIEGYIRRYPAEWGWMHRRWKTPEPGSAGEGGANG